MPDFKSLLTAPLAIAEDGKDLIFPILAKILRGESFDNTEKEGGPKGYYSYVGENLVESDYLETLPNKQGLAVYNITDIINNEDYYYNMSSTRALKRAMMRAEQESSTLGHFLYFNSPGGDATIMIEMGEFIRNTVTKTTFAFFTNMCCSAAYCLAASCDMVYANFRTDRVGSIGVIQTLRDMKAYYVAQGINFVELKSDFSPDKNLPAEKALAGDPQEYKDTFLNPIAEAFIEHIQLVRPATIGLDVFTGKTFLAQDAIGGLIDGIMPYQDAVMHAFDMVRQQKIVNPIYSNSNSLQHMKIFGIDISGDKTDKGVVISAEQYAALEAKANEIAKAEAKETVAAENKPILEALGKLTALVQDQAKELTEIKKWQDETPATKAAAANNPAAPSGEGDEKPNARAELNGTFAKFAQNGVSIS